MRRVCMTWVLLVASMAARAVGATFYVSQSKGDDSRTAAQAQNPATPWKSLAKVNSSTFAPGDVILLRRGDTWNEPLIPPSSGTSGSPIVFDAYWDGPPTDRSAPKITGYVDAGTTWTNVATNVYKATPAALSGTSAMSTVLFNTMMGQKQSSQANVQADRDWFFYNGAVYAHASSANVTSYYGGPIIAIAFGTSAPVTIAGKSWLAIQHLDISWFDGASVAGVSVTGASDHLVFANMAVASQIPYGTTPHGFYVNVDPAPTDIKFYNDDAHLNYDGFRFDGGQATPGALMLVNCAAFGNRDAGLYDNTGGATYSYSHFYGNNVTTIYSQDVQAGTQAGPVAGVGNLGSPVPGSPSYLDPQIAQYGKYAARDTFTVDDVGLAAGTEAYINSVVLPQFTLRGMKFGAAVTTGYPVDAGSVQKWFNLGHDVNAHSWSHQYWTQPNAINLQYIGTGSAATLTIGGNTLATTVTGGPGNENLSLDLTSASYARIQDLVTNLTANYPNSYRVSVYTGALVRTAAHTLGLANAAGQDIKTANYVLQFDKQKLVADEMSTSMTWLNANITGLAEKTYVYPDGQEDASTDGYAVTAGYTGARGLLSMGGALGAGLGANAVASKGLDVQNILSLAATPWSGATPTQFDAMTAALLFKQKLWGYPVGLFIHQPDLTGAEIGYLLDALRGHGATFQKNSEVAAWIAAGSVVPGTTPAGVYFVSPQTGPSFSAARAATSPDVGAGQNLAAALGTETYSYDLNGNHRAGAWDVGAYQMQGSLVKGARLSGVVMR